MKIRTLFAIATMLILASLFSCSSKKTKEEESIPVTPEVKIAPDVNSIYEELKHHTKNGISAEHRELAWRRLFEAKTLDQKLFHAADYMDSFDFQAWNLGFADALVQENTALKEHVLAHDIYELSLSLTTILSKINPKNSEDVYTQDRNLQVFYAIAASLSDIVPPNGDHATHSMYEYIQNGLQQEKDLNTGVITANKISIADQEVSKNSMLFKDTLYARFQYLAYIALEYHHKNPEMANEAMNFAIATKDFLTSIGVEAKLQKKLRIYLKHMKTNDASFREKIMSLLAEDKAKS